MIRLLQKILVKQNASKMTLNITECSNKFKLFLAHGAYHTAAVQKAHAIVCVSIKQNRVSYIATAGKWT